MPVGGVLPKSAPAVGSAGSASCGAAVNVGNGVSARLEIVGVTEPGIAVESESGVNGVDVGRGRGGFRNVYRNPQARTQSAINAHPKPATRSLSNVAKNFLVESIRRCCVI